MEDRAAEDVSRHQVGRELQAAVAEPEAPRQRAGHGGLADAGDIFDEDMTTSEERDDGELHGFSFSAEGASDGIDDAQRGLVRLHRLWSIREPSFRRTDCLSLPPRATRWLAIGGASLAASGRTARARDAEPGTSNEPRTRLGT